MRSVIGRAVLVAFALMGAHPAAGAPIESKISIKVAGGTVSPSKSFIVGLCAGDNPATCQYRCTGTLIAPNVILTARHCLQADNDVRYFCVPGEAFTETKLPPSHFWITTGSRTSDARSQTWHQVRDWTFPPTRALCGGDLAFGILADSTVPAEALPLTPALVKDEADAPGTLTFTGFGGTDSAGTGKGIRRDLVDVPLLCGFGIACPPGLTFHADEFALARGACPGDSGGGAYKIEANGAASLFGVLSRAAPLTADSCGAGIYERLNPWTDTIDAVMRRAAQIGRYEVPAWVATMPLPSRVRPSFAVRTLGAECGRSEDCDSQVCGASDGIAWRCTQNCDSAACPGGFDCASSGDGQFCYEHVVRPPDKQGCTVAATSTSDQKQSWLFAVVAAVGIGATYRLRRRRAR